MRKTAFLLLLILALALHSVILSLPKDAFAYKLPDTDRTKCYNESGTEISCSAADVEMTLTNSGLSSKFNTVTLSH